MSEDLKAVWSVLKEIKDELKRIDDKWERHLEMRSKNQAVLSQLVTSVGHLDQILTRGNGQKPVLSQLAGLHSDVESLKEDHRVLKRASGVKDLTPEEVKKAQADATKAKWIAWGKVAGVLLVAIPGLLALLGVGG